MTNSCGPWEIITQIGFLIFLAQLKQIHLGVAAAYFLATWNKKSFESWTSICLTKKRQARVPNPLANGSKWRQVRWGTWPRDVPTCEEDIIVVDDRGLLRRPEGELVLALTREGGEELGEVKSCVGGLENIFLEWGNSFFYIMVAKEDFFVRTGNYSQGTGNALVTGPYWM